MHAAARALVVKIDAAWSRLPGVRFEREAEGVAGRRREAGNQSDHRCGRQRRAPERDVNQGWGSQRERGQPSP